jgi:ubiquinone/menaquinone biosynthesis C-methylase UbiE
MSSPTAFHDFEQAGWQRAAGHYPDTFGTLTAQTAGPLLKAAGIRSGMRVLDVATGPGYVASAAAACGATVVGLDFSPAMIAEARRRYPGIECHEGDAEALPFGDGTFDAVVMNFGLLHLARPEAAIEQAYRVLVPGGRYAFTVWARPEEAVGFGVVLRAMETHGTTAVGLPDGPPFFRFSDPGECRRALAQAGFRSEGVQVLPLVWRLPSADALFEAALRGGVRTSAALQAQTPGALAAIRAAVRDELQRYADGSTIAVPMHVVLASGGKP